jgi:hypothetical protein
MNWEPVIDALIKVVLLAFFVERALAVIFDMERVEPMIRRNDLKPVVAMAVSIALCFGLNIDAVSPLAPESALLKSTHSSWLAVTLSGLIVAGGSAGAVKLFQDVLGFRRSVRDETKQVEHAQRAAETLEATARAERASAEIAAARVDIATAGARMGDPASHLTDLALESRIADRQLKIRRGE